MKLVASSLANYYETYRQNECLCLIGFTASEDHLQIRYNLVTNFMPYKTSTTIEDQIEEFKTKLYFLLLFYIH